MLKFRICLNFLSFLVKVFREVLHRSRIVFRFVYVIKSPASCPELCALWKSICIGLVAPETQSRSYLFFPVGARGSICIDLQRPEGVLCGRIEFAILFHFDPTSPSWISGAVWQNDLYASSTLPRASDGIYTIHVHVYILFMVSRYTSRRWKPGTWWAGPVE